ncbi:LOW QUALITY PROTEIN: probable magnesium transporter NIPA6 [Hibiscus syriacus]|uniref:LOW QUALITY PROTEIN: probable magnesium transporter NIPA6 n=1 Tax=Hibiscus syriacus TaxID=106335 RepID=UPI0019222827|nr:LOW QUALITY PROTEIN: probable magnesium transporter NIPA6 [Hibiscus syriacus]
MGFSDNSKGLVLAVASSAFIGSSFILKKKGLKRAGASGRAGVGGYTYLLEPLWWAGMITMIVGEVANFVAYVYAPAVLVTPLGALSIIVSACLAHFMLKERIQKMGIVGCVTCIGGSVVIVIHAPQEHTPSSVREIWALATQPTFLIYVAATLSVVLALVLHFEPRYGQTNILVYLGICSLMGSLTVVSIKAIGIAIKLTLDGINQIVYPQTWFFLTVAAICVIMQLNYLNKALDTFNTAIVSPVYYVMFTTLTIIASVIMFKDWSGQNASSIASEICGFITVLSGTIILHATR